MKKIDCFLGIDIGTSSSRGVLVDVQGKILAEKSISHEIDKPQPGYYEQDPACWWFEVCNLSCDLQHSASSATIRALCISSMAPCILPLDLRGRPLRPAILYGIDTRAEKEIEELHNRIGADNIFNMSGQLLSSQSCCPKILWIRHHEKDIWQQTDIFLGATGYLVYRLTGRYSCDIYTAPCYAPLFNIQTESWDDTYSDAIMPIDMLPDLLWSSHVAGKISSEAARETGLPEGIPVITGTADAAAEALSVGASNKGDMMMMFGSSNFFILQTSELRPSKNFWASPFLEPGSSVLCGGMATAGSMFKWFCETFPGRSMEEWDALAEQRGSSHGITVLPYFAGARSPLYNPRAKAVFFGMSLHTEPGDIYRALQESIAFGLRHNLEEMYKEGAELGRIVVIGGASSSRNMIRIIADVCNCPLFLPSCKQGACYGDAFLAALGSGYCSQLADIDTWITMEEEIEPGAGQEYYEQGYQKFRSLYNASRHLM